MADVQKIVDAEFKREVLESKTPVLVDFTATWCAPCKAMAPAIEQLAAQYKGKVKIVEVNVDDNQESAQQFGVRAMPTLLLFQNGKVVKQMVGAQPKGKLEEAIKPFV